MLATEIQYLEDTIKVHLRRFFTSYSKEFESKELLRWCTSSELVQPNECLIYLPTDIAVDLLKIEAWKVPFGETSLTLWNRLPPPSPEWRLQDLNAPLWYIHPSGAITPAWNLARTLFDLLTLSEEKAYGHRDVHGRFVGAMSIRDRAGLLEAPIFNDSVAALVAACYGLSKSGFPSTSLEPGLVNSPLLVLSHDLDQLRGNDFWTQVARLSRAVLPKGRHIPQIKNIWYAFCNAVSPRRYYFNNIIGMIAIERMLGFTSSFYFLNGTGGRLGARSGSALISEVISIIPVNWNVGIHYNYDTFLNENKFSAQRLELREIMGKDLSMGRAHYLRFDPVQSWSFLVNIGIKVDESLGFPDRVGYRAGIAGPFQPYDEKKGRAMPLLEMPLVFMESVLLDQYSGAAYEVFSRHLKHISVVGGALSLLFHPGNFHNPEFPEMLGLYRRLLGIARQMGAKSSNMDDFDIS